MMEKSGLKILIVEDDLIIAENLKENLHEMGYGEVLNAADSNQGIALFRHFAPDLCLVDIQLNGSPLDGIEMVASEDMGRKVPVIYLSSFADKDTRDRAKGTNPATYLIKPADKVQIDAAVDIALSTFYSSIKEEKIEKLPLHSGGNFVFLKVKSSGHERYEKFYMKDIAYIEADGSYSLVYVDDRVIIVSMTLAKVLEALNYPEIIRCHRSYAVNIGHIHSFDVTSFYLSNGHELVSIPISDQYKNEVHARLYKI